MRKVTDISLAGLFGALLVVSSLFPLSVAIGGYGIFNFMWVMQAVTGVLLGPVVGGMATVAGAMVAFFLNPTSPFGPLAPLLPLIAALAAGLITWRYWWVESMLLGVLVLGWFVTPVGIAAWPTAIFHAVGIGLLLGFGRKLPSWTRNTANKATLMLGWGMTAYCANITRHMLGNILVATMLGAPAVTFWIALPYTAVEQVAFATIATLIGAPVLIAVVKSGLDMPITRLAINQAPIIKNKEGDIPDTRP